MPWVRVLRHAKSAANAKHELCIARCWVLLWSGGIVVLIFRDRKIIEIHRYDLVAVIECRIKYCARIGAEHHAGDIREEIPVFSRHRDIEDRSPFTASCTEWHFEQIARFDQCVD